MTAINCYTFVSAMQSDTHRNIVLFDGVCNLCNASVQFIIRHDKGLVFSFASLQSETANDLLKDFSYTATNLESIVLIENNRLYTRSTAALHIAKNLKGAARLLYTFIIIPRPLRDWVYNWIARNRYRWFGRKESCMVPTKELQARFLE